MPNLRSSLFVWALVPLSLAVVAAIGITQQDASTISGYVSANPDLLRVYETTTLPNNEPLPPVVARLGDLQLTGSAFAERVAEVRYNNTRYKLGKTESQIRHAAFDGWFRQAALHERAKGEGIIVTDAEVHTYLVQQAKGRHAVLAANPQSAADYQAFIEAHGYKNPDDYDRDPNAIREARWLLETTKLLKRDVPGATQAQQDAFVAATMAQAKVEMFLSLG